LVKLHIKDDAGKTTTVPMARDEITIGRKDGNTIRLTEKNVSRTHARLIKKGEEVHVEDLSRYGTRVNGERIQQIRRVGAGDTIQIGDYTLTLEGLKAVEPPAPAAQVAAAPAPVDPKAEARKKEVEQAAHARHDHVVALAVRRARGQRQAREAL
jgi:pSer/pThr/pTyr-binding forkhead associated (FHA) protein